MKPVRLATAHTVVAVASALVIGSLATPADAALFGGKKADAPQSPEAKGKGKTSATADEGRPRKASAQERLMAERLEPLARVAFWSREMQVDPTDAEAGVKLSAGLRQIGRYDEAFAISGQVLVAHPDNVEALLESARARIGEGAPFYAIEPLQRARAAAPKDWRPVSLLGVALGQTERPAEAQEAFRAALQLSPENPSILSNLAMFQAARGDKDQAELLLRRAVAAPGSGARERQNLALILGLQGKMAEAESLLRQDLPPEVAAANLAYLKGAPAPAANRNWNNLSQ